MLTSSFRNNRFYHPYESTHNTYTPAYELSRNYIRHNRRRLDVVSQDDVMIEDDEFNEYCDLSRFICISSDISTDGYDSGTPDNTDYPSESQDDNMSDISDLSEEEIVEVEVEEEVEETTTIINNAMAGG
jgi:hypothetical protein